MAIRAFTGPHKHSRPPWLLSILITELGTPTVFRAQDSGIWPFYPENSCLYLPRSEITSRSLVFMWVLKTQMPVLMVDKLSCFTLWPISLALMLVIYIESFVCLFTSRVLTSLSPGWNSEEIAPSWLLIT